MFYDSDKLILLIEVIVMIVYNCIFIVMFIKLKECSLSLSMFKFDSLFETVANVFDPQVVWKRIYFSCIWDKGFRINFQCWKMSSYTHHVRRVACDDVTISGALLLYKIAFILLGSSLKQ